MEHKAGYKRVSTPVLAKEELYLQVNIYQLTRKLYVSRLYVIVNEETKNERKILPTTNELPTPPSL